MPVQEGRIQTRSEENGLAYYETVEAAFTAAKNDDTIWKISFNVGHERVRMVRVQHPLPAFKYESILEGLWGGKEEGR